MISKAGFYTHNHPIQVHHLLKPSDGKRGLSLKSGDDQTVPLCEFHHRELHTKFGNEFAFFKHYGFKETAGQEEAAKLYAETLALREEDSDLPF